MSVKDDRQHVSSVLSAPNEGILATSCGHNFNFTAESLYFIHTTHDISFLPQIFMFSPFKDSSASTSAQSSCVPDVWSSVASPHEVQNHELVGLPFHVTVGLRPCEAGERRVRIAVPRVKPGEKKMKLGAAI
jgi:hypothetical protein